MGSTSRTGQRTAVPPLLEIDRPNFFGGQALNDKDLSAILTWAEQRWRLEASCDDWGIACGLHVSIEPENSSQLLISHGYGITATRQLCIVTQEDCSCRDRSQCKCRERKDAKAFCLSGASCHGSCNATTDEISIGPLNVKVKSSELAIFDLRLIPSECEKGHSLGLSSDGRRNCQPSRYRVSAAIECVKAEEPSQTGDNRRESKAIQFLNRFPNDVCFPLSADGAVKIRKWITKEAKAFSELLTVGPSLVKVDTTEEQFTEILSWMCFAIRRAGQCRKESCKEAAIPLARVWARCNGSTYEVLFIDDTPPYRRSLCFPTQKFCLSDWIGRPFGHAAEAARKSGLELSYGEWESPKTLSELKTFFSGESELQKAKLQKQLTAHCIGTHCLEDQFAARILGFSNKSVGAAGSATPTPAENSEDSGQTLDVDAIDDQSSGDAPAEPNL